MRKFWQLHLFLPGNEKGGNTRIFSGTTAENCTLCDISAAARHFSRTLGKSLNESIVQGMKTSYLKLKKSTDESLRGDAEVCYYITYLRKSGGVENRHIVIAAAKGIIMAMQRSEINEVSTTSCFSIF